jgi:Kef-type K+ transport system membrane component KefB/CBS domain-containing protein
MLGTVEIAVPLGMIPGPGLLFGLMLVAGIVGSHAARRVHIPRVVGFLLSGIALRAVLLGVLPSGGDGAVDAGLSAAAEPLGAIRDLALGLILFTVGGVFERSRLRAAGAAVLKISACETALSMGFVFAGCAAVTLFTQAEFGLGENMVLSLLLGAAAIATAPAATLFVLQEYDAKGPLTERILALTGINNVVCIVLFFAVFLILAAVGGIATSQELASHAWVGLMVTTLGSAVLGVACGVLISVAHSRLPLTETLLVFFALFVVLGAGEKWLLEHVGMSFSFLLTALVVGAVFSNVGVDSEKLSSMLRTVGAPIFAGFFVMAGFDLHVGDFKEMGWLGVVYVLCRFFGKGLGCHFGVRACGEREKPGVALGSSLLCQAAVVLGLASFVRTHWQSELASQFSTVILGSVVVFELVGPLLLKRCVVQNGEVKAITLLRRSSPDGESGSALATTVRALRRVFSRQTGQPGGGDEALTVSHIMRSSVQLISASATLDEVLHFIERSTYAHFPVVDQDGGFAGMIHMNDLRDMIYDPALRDLVTAVDLADAGSAVIAMDTKLSDALDTFAKANVSMLPVVEHADSVRIVGVVEQRDLLRALHLSQSRA